MRLFALNLPGSLVLPYYDRPAFCASLVYDFKHRIFSQWDIVRLSVNYFTAAIFMQSVSYHLIL